MSEPLAHAPVSQASTHSRVPLQGLPPCRDGTRTCLVLIFQPASHEREHSPKMVQSDSAQSCAAAVFLAHGVVSRRASGFKVLPGQGAPSACGICLMALIRNRCIAGEEHWLHMPQSEMTQSNSFFVLGAHRFVSISGPSQGVPNLLLTVRMCRFLRHKPASLAFVHFPHAVKTQSILAAAAVQFFGAAHSCTSVCVPEHMMFPVPEVPVNIVGSPLSGETGGFVVEIFRDRCRLVTEVPHTFTLFFSFPTTSFGHAVNAPQSPQ